jgi:DNA-binding LacI/PurR family transcriptional regulator
MVSNNKLLLGLLQALDERQILIPDDVSVLGFDDYAWNKYFNPSLTAIAQPTFEMGRRAFQLLLQIVERGKNVGVSERRIRLNAELRVRNSTAPVLSKKPASVLPAMSGTPSDRLTKTKS